MRAAHWYGEDDSPRISSAKGLYRRPGRHAGSDTIVYQDRGSSSHFRLGALSAEELKASFGFFDLFGCYPCDVLFGDAELSDNPLVKDTQPALSDSADTEFRLVRCTKLTCDEDVKRRIQSTGDLVPHRHPS